MRVLMSVTTWDAERIKADLKKAGFAVTTADDGIAIFECLDLIGHPAVLMETDLPDVAWKVALSQLRAEGPNLPVLLIDSHDSQADRLEGLKLGADDIIDTSMSADEIAARVMSVVTRRAGFSGPDLHLGRLKLDLRQHKVWWDIAEIPLSPAQYTLLEGLCLASPRAVSKDDMMGSLYGIEDASAPRTIDVFITQLRARLVAAGAPWSMIETVRGRGYALADAYDAADTFTVPTEDFGIPCDPFDRGIAA